MIEEFSRKVLIPCLSVSVSMQFRKFVKSSEQTYNFAFSPKWPKFTKNFI